MPEQLPIVLVNRHQDAAFAAKGHASMGDEEVVDQEEISALPEKFHGCAVDRTVDGVQVGDTNRISVAQGGVEWPPIRRRERGVVKEPPRKAGAAGRGHKG